MKTKYRVIEVEEGTKFIPQVLTSFMGVPYYTDIQTSGAIPNSLTNATVLINRHKRQSSKKVIIHEIKDD